MIGKSLKIGIVSACMNMLVLGVVGAETPFVPPTKVEPSTEWQTLVNANSFVPSQTVLILKNGVADLRVTLPFGSAYSVRAESDSKYPRGTIVTDGGNFFYDVTAEALPYGANKKYHYVEGLPYEISTNEDIKKATFERPDFKNSKLKDESSIGKYEQRGLVAAYWDYLPYFNDTKMIGTINFALEKDRSVQYHMGFDAPGKPIAMSMKALFTVLSPSVRPASVVDAMADAKSWNGVNYYVPKGFEREKTDDLNQLLYVSNIGEVYSLYKMDIGEMKKDVPDKELLGGIILGEVSALQEEKSRLSLISTVWNRASAIGYVESERTLDGTVYRTMTSLYPAGQYLYRIDYRYSINSAPANEQLMRDIVQSIWVNGADRQAEGYGVLGNLFTGKL